ncbi:39S ribosomal protein L40, mitochondrial [Toxorhynchites rutilus septentrionalis]|uniref:39S ribosomal protein L40, mitochondrial n=1 Tax=Toxorhynchites rutilus septentrionalis TaxID=329112 RepID=UPI002479891F|nr:39S ribosomal protein L40, mitochondrial [Toxorhynchites rutilus septentrionalis]
MFYIGSLIRSLPLSSAGPFALRSIHTGSGNYFHYTPVLCAEPLKKKKKIDPQVLKQREERKKKRLEKQIRRLEKNARQLKPVEDLDIPIELIDEREQRKRTGIRVTPEVLESRVLLEKQWAKHKRLEKLADYQLIDKVLAAQTKALNELRFESEELYQKAIEPDMGIVPLKVEGPVATPPIDGYDMPDGEYIDVSKKWE